MITLTPMTEADFDVYLSQAIQGYAADKVAAGNWSAEEALERSGQEFTGLLPQGLATARNFLYQVINPAGLAVGYLWYCALPRQPGVAFIYDFEIYAPYRRQGYARQALAALDADARSRGFTRLELHVFAHNQAARALYHQAGFVETNVQMAKPIT